MIEINGYDAEKIRSFILEFDKILAQSPRPVLDNNSAHLIIKNLIEALKTSVNIMESLRKDIEMTKLLYSSGAISNAKN